MRSTVIGGGPAGLYYGILARKLDPAHEVVIHERNRPGETFGWGVVFSDATLDTLADADPESFAEIQRNFAYWKDIDIFLGDRHVRSTGHGFCGLRRTTLLDILERRALALGCTVLHESEIRDVGPLLGENDLVLAADGVNSHVRDAFQHEFQPSLDWRKCKFAWLGTDHRYEAFTFLFRENKHGLFQVHAYPFDATTSTFIVECREDTWRAAGLDHADEAATCDYVERLFGPDLHGGRLLRNKSTWRTFPTIRCARWTHENLVLAGDAAHTAHFSIGSGTKLAMESVIALVDTLRQRGNADIPAALQAYEARRRPEVERLQHSAQTSLEWFESSSRYTGFDPVSFAFSLMTRSKRITWDDLGTRDPDLVQRVRQAWSAGHSGREIPAFTPLRLRGVELPNRLVVSPMCQYSAVDGAPTDWHLVHLGSRAIGGAGLVMAEATAPSADGRITLGCTGLYADAQVPAWRRITEFVHSNSSAKVGIQLAHAGRKGACMRPWEQGGAPLPPHQAWPLVAPSAIAYDARSATPRAMTADDLARVRDDFGDAAARADAAGFDVLELHMAHGYLLNTFLSPLTNRRDDAYGGSMEARLRFPLEVVAAVRGRWPEDKPLFARVSMTEWAPAGLDDEDRVQIARALHAAGVDVIDCSSGGVVPEQAPVYGRMFNVKFADLVRNVAGVPAMTVGNVQDVDQANTILAAGRADLVAMARPHLADPYLANRAAAAMGVSPDGWPVQYRAGVPRRR